jgi:DNA mismatch repair protein MutL
LESQRLLVPEPVPLSPTEFALVDDARSALTQLGIAVEPFGGTTMLVTSYPAMLANQNPADLLRSVVELLGARTSALERRDVLDELMHMISCKAAVKAGDRLTAAEIDALIEHRSLCQDAHHCPHGRPTALIFSRDELDRRFLRT